MRACRSLLRANSQSQCANQTIAQNSALVFVKPTFGKQALKTNKPSAQRESSFVRRRKAVRRSRTRKRAFVAHSSIRDSRQPMRRATFLVLFAFCCLRRALQFFLSPSLRFRGPKGEACERRQLHLSRLARLFRVGVPCDAPLRSQARVPPTARAVEEACDNCRERQIKKD